MADKGDVYYCTWEKTDADTYVGWGVASPGVAGRGRFADSDLMPALGEVVGEASDDHEAALCFDPPLSESKADAILFADGWISVGWNCSYTYHPSAKNAFTGGRCASCQHGIGSRDRVKR